MHIGAASEEHAKAGLMLRRPAYRRRCQMNHAEGATHSSRPPSPPGSGSDAPEAAGQLALEWEKLRFEQRKYAIEVRFRRRELENDKNKSALKAMIANPLTLAVVAGIITLLTTIVSNYFTARENRESETLKAQLAEKSARDTLQADLIKKFVESPTAESVRQNLRFLVDAGLIPTYADNIRQYLDANPGIAPRLGSGIEFSPGGELVENVVKERIQTTVAKYRTFLRSIGFSRLDENVSVFIFSEDKRPPNFPSDVNAFYLSNTIYIHKKMIGDVSVALREYTHHALFKALDFENSSQDQVESALADYLPASFLNSPVIGDGLGPLFGRTTNYIRTLATGVAYNNDKSIGPVQQGEAWAAALWACRTLVGQGSVDNRVLSAWRQAKIASEPDDSIAGRFGKALAAAEAPAGTCFVQEISRRKLP
jgi:hypothetical protein